MYCTKQKKKVLYQQHSFMNELKRVQKRSYVPVEAKKNVALSEALIGGNLPCLSFYVKSLKFNIRKFSRHL